MSYSQYKQLCHSQFSLPQRTEEDLLWSYICNRLCNLFSAEEINTLSNKDLADLAKLVEIK